MMVNVENTIIIILFNPHKPILVGALEHDFYDVPFSWEFHHPN